LKRLRYNSWMPFSWHGIRIEIPEEWNPGKIVGDPKSGNVRLDDTEIIRVELEWKSAEGDNRVDRIVDRYIEGLAKQAQKEKRSLNVERRIDSLALTDLPFDDVTTFSWRSSFDVHTLACYSDLSDRLIFVRVMSRPEEDATELLQRVFGSLGDTAIEAEQSWSLFGLEVTSPPGYGLEEYDLKSGHIRLQFGSGKSILQVDRISLANALLSGISLSDWYTGFFGKDLRYVNYEVSSWDTQGDDGIALEGVPKSRAQSLLQPLPFWDARPRRFYTARAWLEAEENRILTVQSFWRTPEEAPDIDTVAKSAVQTHLPTTSEAD
jgi:hypothetical protein